MTQTNTPRRIFLVDDHPVVLSGIQAMIDPQPDLEVAGVAGNLETAVEGIGRHRPDLVVLDISLPGKSGLMLLEHLQLHCNSLPALALTIHDEAASVQQVLQAGGRGFVLKRSAAEELIHAIRAVLMGGVYIDPAVAGKIVHPPRGMIDGAPPLSEREESVIRLVAKGFSNKEISSQLTLSVKTVETYRSRASEKLGLRTRASLVRYATLEGWMTE